MAHPMSQSIKETPQITNALYYARLGWSVVPAHRVIRNTSGATICSCPQGADCVSKGKHPAVPWVTFQKIPATEAQIMAWFNGPFADYGVGVITGAVSGIFVIDSDQGQGKPGAESLNDIQMINGDLPYTVQAKTGGGGVHYVFKHPGNGTLITTAKNVLGAGVDVRGDGGFIVTAPSIHESGRHYIWDDAANPRTTRIVDAPAWVIDLARGDASSSGQRGKATGSGEIIRDAWGNVVDGRERHMVSIVCGVIASQLRITGVLPTAEAVVEEAWPSYERTTKARGASLDADGRGLVLMRHRAGHMLRRASSGKWKVSANPSEKEEDAPGSEWTSSPDNADKRGSPDIFETLDIAGLLALPPVEWLIAGLLTTDGFSVVYGPPGSLKTFLVLDQCLHICANRPWHGRAVRSGKVLYVAGEGVRGIARRIKAWCLRYEVDPSELPFRLLAASINLSQPEVVKKLIRTAVAQMEEDGECVALVVIDTVARSIPGLDENSAQEMGTFVSAVEKIKLGIGSHLLGVHHSGKDETRGARGSNALLGAVDTMVRVKRDKDRLTVEIEKQKDDDEGEPIQFRTVPVEWMTGMRAEKSLVLIADGVPVSSPKDATMALLVQVALVLGANGRMVVNQVAVSMGLSGRKRQEFANSIPLAPDYINVTLPNDDLVVRLARARRGPGSTSPVEVVRYDPR